MSAPRGLFGGPGPVEPTPVTHRPAKPTLASQLLTRGELAHLPQPEPLIEGTLDRGTVAVLGGYTGSLKSFTALAMACSVATGVRWLGRTTTVTGPVLYIAAEGASGLNTRIAAWEQHHETQVEDLFTLPRPVNLLDPAVADELVEMVTMDEPALIVVDTLARCLVGGDENSARDVGVAVDVIYRLRDAGGSTVVVVHHAGLDKTRLRGSTALESGVDTVYLADGTAERVRLRRTKRKEGAVEDDLHIGLRRVEGTGSGVIVEVSQAEDDGGTELPDSQRQLLSVMRNSFGATGATGAQLRESVELPRTTYYAALNKLIDKGLVVNSGTLKRPFYELPDDTEE